MSALRRRLAEILGSLLLRVAPGAAYFPENEDDDPLTPDRWAALLVLHAEAVHDCTHTDQARSELGMIGPRGKPS